MAKRCCRIYDYLIIDATAPFSAFRSESVKYHKLSLFTLKFGGFLGEELGDGYPPKFERE